MTTEIKTPETQIGYEQPTPCRIETLIKELDMVAFEQFRDFYDSAPANRPTKLDEGI